MKTVYIERLTWYGDSPYPFYLNLKNAEIYGLDEALAKFGFKTQKEIEESSDFVRLFYVDYNELVRDFIRLYNDDDLTEASKKWTDEETFDDKFRWYMDGDSPLEDAWYDYEEDRLWEEAVKWCKENNIKYSTKKFKWGRR